MQHERPADEPAGARSDHCLTLDRDWRILEGVVSEASHEAGARSFWAAFPQLRGTRLEAAGQEAMTLGIARCIEVSGVEPDAWHQVIIYPTGSGITLCWTDITAQKRKEDDLLTREARQAFIVRLIDTLRPLTDSMAIQYHAARLLGEYLGADRVIYRDIDEAAGIADIRPDYHAPGFASIAGRYPYADFADIATAVRDGDNLVVSDVSRSQLSRNAHAVYRRLGVQSFIVVPLIEHSRLIWTLSVAAARPRTWTDEEVSLVEEVGKRTWEATARLDAEEALRASEAQARSLVEQLQLADQNRIRFLNVLSHELRNPLAALTMSLSLLEQSRPESRQGQRALEIMGRQIAQLSHLVDDLLDVSRITQGKLVLNCQPVELNEFVRRVVTDHRLIFAERGVALDMDLAAGPIELDADPIRLTQMIGNLLNNALKFSAQGDRVRVSVALEAEAVVRVVDTGVGIDPVNLPYLFESFVQAENTVSRSQGGLGLGLAIVKGLAELHGGRVEATSEGLGKGAAFTIWLPVQKAAEDAVQPAVGDASQPSQCLRILMIEDNTDLSDIMREVFLQMGHTFKAAATGPSGMALARTWHPDVILCDIGLPGMDGYETARAIRQDSQLNGAFLIAVSGFANPEDLEQSRAAGFDRHLVKPVSMEALRQVLAEVPGPHPCPDPESSGPA